MKIVCDACATKYSIADDKLKGKVFKIRCKKCSHVIVVRGADAAPVEELPPPPASEGIWHLVIDDDQVGPFTEEDVRARIGRGDATRDTFAWCEGLAEWSPLAQVDVFAPLFVEPQPAADDLFAVAAAPAQAPVVETPRGGARLLAERNESSVLFSMNNLARLAGPAPARAPAVEPGAPLQEGSGLIDIRSMATAYRGTATATPAKGSAGIGSLDDLPVFAPGGFSEPAVLVPTVARSSNRMMHVMIAAVALLAVIAIVLVVVLLKGHDAPAQVAIATPPPEPVVIAPPPAPSPPPPPVVAAPTPEPPPAAPPPPAHAAPAPRNHAAPPVAHAPATRAPKVEQHASPPPAAASSEECDEIKCLVNSDLPCCRKRATPKAEIKDTSLPQRLASSMITSSLDPVRPKVMACGAAIKGKVRIHVKVGGDGKVSEATVAESPDPGAGTCAANAVKRATFPKTQAGGTFYVPYLF